MSNTLADPVWVQTTVISLVDTSVTAAGASFAAYTSAPFAVGPVGVEDGHQVETV